MIWSPEPVSIPGYQRRAGDGWMDGHWRLAFYVLVTFKVISGWLPTWASAHSWWFYSAAALENQAANTWLRTESHYPDLTSPCPILVMPSISRLGSNHYQCVIPSTDSTGNWTPYLLQRRPALYRFGHRAQWRQFAMVDHQYSMIGILMNAATECLLYPMMRKLNAWIISQQFMFEEMSGKNCTKCSNEVFFR